MDFSKADVNKPKDLLPYLHGQVLVVHLPKDIRPIDFLQRVVESTGEEELPGTIIEMFWLALDFLPSVSYYYKDESNTWQTREAEKCYFSKKVVHNIAWEKTINWDILPKKTEGKYSPILGRDE